MIKIRIGTQMKNDDERDKDRDNDEGSAGMPVGLGHEKLKVYVRGLDHVAWLHTVLAGVEQSSVVVDHWIRAAENIIENIANGNSRRSRADRNRYFDVAIGSALECAACLDICLRRDMISDDQLLTGKKILQPIVNMTIGLREAKSAYVREAHASYLAVRSEVFFAHEGLDAYKVTLEWVSWLHCFLPRTDIGASYAQRLDKGTTTVVLNIAEGTGRFSEAEQTRFLDIAYTCAIRVAACLDVLAARQQVERPQIAEGKRILARVVPLVLGLRGYLDDRKSKE
jgi:four helix bundle protein